MFSCAILKEKLATLSLSMRERNGDGMVLLSGGHQTQGVELVSIRRISIIYFKKRLLEHD